MNGMLARIRRAVRELRTTRRMPERLLTDKERGELLAAISRRDVATAWGMLRRGGPR